MLDDFSNTNISQKKPESAPQVATAPPPVPAAAAGAGTSAEDKALDDILGDEDFAKQLQAGMADLLGELDKNVGSLAFLLARAH